MTRWFRFYEDVMDDPKVQLLSDAHYRQWTTLLCVASKNDGEIPGHEPTLAFALRKPPGKVRDILQVLLSAELIDRKENGNYEPHNWNGRQFKSDVSNERVKRHRERHKPVTGNYDVTLHVTPPETEAETDTKTDKKEDTSLRSVAVSKPKIEIPEWIPKEAWEGFLDMRNKIRAKPTDRAILLLIAELRKMRATEDIGAVLDQSTMRGWKSVFPVKHQGNANGQGRSKPPSAHDNLNAGTVLYLQSLGLGADADEGGKGPAIGDADSPGLPLLAPRLLA